MSPSVRLLPVLVIVAFIALGIRIADVVTGESMRHDPLAFDAVVTLTQAQAAEAGGAADAGKTPEPAQPAAGKDAMSKPAGGDKPMATAMANDKAGHGDAADDDNEDLWFDPEGRDLSRSELRLLQELSSRRKQLEDRERGLDQREALLEAAEKKFNEKLNELNGLRDQIKVLVKKHTAEQDAQLASLVKIYESMKPKDAARIFDALDMDVLLDVVVRMKEAKSAAVLAQMDPTRVKEVTLQLVDRGRLPQSVVLQ